MRLYTQEHQFYCGVDLHARSMYLCILDQSGTVVLHRNMNAEPQVFLSAIAPYRQGIVVCAECMFTWYWLADLCARENIPFILGHALYMKAIHGGTRNILMQPSAFNWMAAPLCTQTTDQNRCVLPLPRARSLTGGCVYIQLGL